MNVRLLLPALLMVALPAVAQSSLTSSAPVTWGSEPVAGALPLPEAMAFRSEIVADRSSAMVRLTPSPGYYLYRHTFKAEASGAVLGELSTNKGESHNDPHFGTVEVFYGPADLTIPIQKAPPGPLNLRVSFQGCQKEGICYPPMERTFTVDMGTAAGLGSAATPPLSGPETAQPKRPAPANLISQPPQAEDQQLAAVLNERPLWQAWGIFLGLGLLLGLTPCVLPMVPILMGLVAGAQVRSTRQGLGLAAVYVMAHATVFALLGALAAWIGAGVQAVFQQSWAVLPMAGLMALLGVAMVLGMNLQMPVRVQQWAGQRGRGGQWLGVMAMGALSSLIVGPCVAPPLAGAVLFLAQEGDPTMGAGALFCLGVGMGLPLLVAGAGLGKWLPQSGRWGTWLTRGMGLGFVALAIWLAARVMPLSTAAGMAAVVLALVAAWLGGRGNAGREHGGRPVMAGLALSAALAAGVAWAQLKPEVPLATKEPSLFAQVDSTQQLDQRLAQAQAAGKTVMLDFYADWCTACLDMEKQTFADAAVRQRLQGQDLVILKADVTANTPEQRELMKRYGIIGPPATLFFQGNQEARPLRLVGFEGTEPFLKRVDTAAQCQAPLKEWTGAQPKTQIC